MQDKQDKMDKLKEEMKKQVDNERMNRINHILERVESFDEDVEYEIQAGNQSKCLEEMKYTVK